MGLDKISFKTEGEKKIKGKFEGESWSVIAEYFGLFKIQNR